MLFTLVYVSRATRLLTRPELENLLLECRTRNQSSGITGMLLYRDGNIMQLLEGEEDTVRRVYDKIALDSRHHGMVNVWVGYDAHRQFPDWTMGFRDLDEAPVTLAGYSDVLARPVTPQEFGQRPNLGQELLEMFTSVG